MTVSEVSTSEFISKKENEADFSLHISKKEDRRPILISKDCMNDITTISNCKKHSCRSADIIY